MLDTPLDTPLAPTSSSSATASTASPQLGGRHVIVTGGHGALGRAVVHALEAEGAICHIPAPRSGGGVNLTDEASVVEFFDGAPAPLWGSIHLAGGFSMGPVETTSAADLRALHETNAVTCFLACREAIRRMNAGGRIVNVAARPALVPTARMAAYSAAKAAVCALTLALAEEVKERGILVNAVVPSIIDTLANRTAMPAANRSGWPRPEELAETLLWLVSPRMTLTTGALVPVYGRA